MEEFTVGYLCSVVQEKCGIPGCMLRLFHEGKLLRNNSALNLLPDDANITVLLKNSLCGGSKECDICGNDATYECQECCQYFCEGCCQRFHQHSKRNHHMPKRVQLVDDSGIEVSQFSSNDLTVQSNDDCCSNDDYFNDEEVFTQAMMIATLAEKFGMTEFKPFQKEIIKNLLAKRDCLVIEPTGSGKSLCFQYTAVYQKQISLIITPTISLMQDQVTNAVKRGLNAAYLESAQMDKTIEQKSFNPKEKIDLIYVTPEWITKDENLDKVLKLIRSERLALIAFDEAHLYHYWQEFRPAYKELKYLKEKIINVPLLALTATATPQVKQSILEVLRHPYISESSINRSNIYLACEESPLDNEFNCFATRVLEIVGNDCAVIYIDFINSIGPIVNQLYNLHSKNSGSFQQFLTLHTLCVQTQFTKIVKLPVF